MGGAGVVVAASTAGDGEVGGVRVGLGLGAVPTEVIRKEALTTSVAISSYTTLVPCAGKESSQ